MRWTRRPQTGLDIEALYRRHGGSVRRRIRRFYSEEEADDVLQEVFLHAMNKLHTFRGESSPSTWLYTLTTRYCLNRIRNAGRRRELWAEKGNLGWCSPISDSDQEEKLMLRQLWAQLDPELVEIGVYYHVDGMSHGEIAKLMGCSRRTIGNRIKALEEAARALAERREEPS